MRQVIICILCLTFICGCSNKKNDIKPDIHTIIKEEENYIVGINYPTIGYSKFDRKAENYVNEVYQDFIKEYSQQHSKEGKGELNIDYKYNLVNKRYVNVIFTVFINSPYLAHPITSIKTMVFDTKKQKNLSFGDIISADTLEKLVPTMQTLFISEYKDCIFMDKVLSTVTKNFNNYQLFTFTDKELIIYFNPYQVSAGYCNVVRIKLPLKEVSLKIPIEKEIVNREVLSFLPKSRVIDPTKKVIALTFDDGPSRYTKDILNILELNKAVGTFFVLGNKVEIYQDVLKKSLLNGNELGNHTYNHKDMNRLSIREIKRQVFETQKIINETTGYIPTCFRPTYGNMTKAIRKSVDLKIILWNLDTRDWAGGSPKKIANRVLMSVRDGSVILMHDTYLRTKEAVGIIVPELKKEGYQFVTIRELEEVKRIRENSYNY
ncbi:MAG: polysaccharide deacetylase family protein [Bacilli bacterium]